MNKSIKTTNKTIDNDIHVGLKTQIQLQSILFVSFKPIKSTVSNPVKDIPLFELLFLLILF